MTSLVRSVRFDAERHRVEGFCCGQPELDSWLIRHAAVAERMRTAATYVWVVDGRVVGFYSLAPHAISREVMPARVGRNVPAMVPAYLLGKLGLAEEWQGRGRGSALLLDACARLATAMETAPARVVVVDALDERAAAFYVAHGFRPIGGRALTLFMTAADLMATIEAARGGEPH